MMERKFDLAIEQLHKSRATGAAHVPDTHYDLGAAYEADKQYDKAMDEYEQCDLLDAARPGKYQDAVSKKAWSFTRKVLAAGGKPNWMKPDRIRTPTPTGWHNAALAWVTLMKSLRSWTGLARNTTAAWLVSLEDDCFDPFHDDPRFKELVKKMGFHPIPGAVR